MRIAQVAPLYESVPPKLYGGTERVVSFLTEELVRQGHEVTLFASGDSHTQAELFPVVKQAIRLNADCIDSLAPHIVEIQEVIDRADEFDILHFHIDYLHFPFTRQLRTPSITTLHGRLDIPELKFVYDKFKQLVVSISNDQRTPLPQANFTGTVYHGLPVDLFRAGDGRGNYLAFLGRISPEKGLDKAIEWARASGMKLKVAAKIDKADQAYFDAHIKHLLDDPLIEFIGEINEEQKQEFLGNAAALAFPIDWNEPFGMVMIEAMACGTPVIAHSRGSVPEVIEPGKSGYLVSSVEEAIKAIHDLPKLSRGKVRAAFEDRFTSTRMADDYLEIYKRLVEKDSLRVSHLNPGLGHDDSPIHSFRKSNNL